MPRPDGVRLIERHRRERLRLRDFDYASPGPYFVTICTRDRRAVFGDVVFSNGGGGAMALNALGRIAERCWLDLRTHYPTVELENFVVMPNHVHGIIVLKPGTGAGGRMWPLSEILRGYKTFSSRAIGAGRPSDEPLWQRGFHDRIVRNEREPARIREYIDNNPLRWGLDRENPERPIGVAPAEAGLLDD
jgi:REP element-mobilizing transposase RayT